MRILILGATGMLGHKLCQQLGRRFPDTHATVRTDRVVPEDFAYLRDVRLVTGVDATHFVNVRTILEQLVPQVIVNCIAVTIRRTELYNEASTIELNSALPHRLKDWAAAHGARLIHFSTDCVFDGRTGGYTEETPCNATDLYGRSKARGEITGPGVLTLRTSFIGREIRHGTELLEWFLAQGGKRIKGYRNAIYTGVSTIWMARLIGELIERFPHLEGLYQVASPRISKYELLRLAREAYGLQVEIEPEDSVVIRRDLNGERFRAATGIEVPGWPQMMSELACDPTAYPPWRTADAA